MVVMTLKATTPKTDADIERLLDVMQDAVMYGNRGELEYDYKTDAFTMTLALSDADRAKLAGTQWAEMMTCVMVTHDQGNRGGWH